MYFSLMLITQSAEFPEKSHYFLWGMIQFYIYIYIYIVFFRLFSHIGYCRAGEVNGNPFWYSCLENRFNRGALWATVHGVAKESDVT